MKDDKKTVKETLSITASAWNIRSRAHETEVKKICRLRGMGQWVAVSSNIPHHLLLWFSGTAAPELYRLLTKQHLKKESDLDLDPFTQMLYPLSLQRHLGIAYLWLMQYIHNKLTYYVLIAHIWRHCYCSFVFLLVNPLRWHGFLCMLV